VLVAVMQIRVVRMTVGQRFMPVRMGVGFLPVPIEIVRMLVVLVAHVFVLHGFVRVLVLVHFAQVQPHAQPAYPG
jgi:hypothetical protein